MKKVNNHGFTLIEMLLALAILSIFMVTVIFFMFTESRSTKMTRQQIQTQQDANEAYSRISDLIMQASCVDIRTSGDVDGKQELSGNAQIDVLSKSAVDSIRYAVKGQGINSIDAYTGAGYHCVGIGTRSRYRKSSLGKYTTFTHTVSRPEFEAARMYLTGLIHDNAYSVFNSNNTKMNYKVDAIYFGPVITDAYATNPTQFKTVVYDRNTRKIYVNTSSTGADFSTNPDSLLADNCEEFLISTDDPSLNSLKVKLTFFDNKDDPSYRYTTGGTVVIRNGGILQ